MLLNLDFLANPNLDRHSNLNNLNYPNLDIKTFHILLYNEHYYTYRRKNCYLF